MGRPPVMDPWTRRTAPSCTRPKARGPRAAVMSPTGATRAVHTRHPSAGTRPRRAAPRRTAPQAAFHGHAH
ncbi:hypothetical protein GUJ93_ZPchr0010g8741 [Zizania palustris]|uniref:Uncharacterized protein n=1 Tax=Zizania palustris TaxID=103762 RepID=A0A8J5W9M0_ZIZPA|nr:hypothetical protein GUJ93_ZPchr0010g8741 [Zizania palustris]